MILKLASTNHSTNVLGKGTVTVNNGGSYELKETLYVPQIATNLLSVGKITDNGYKVVFETDKAYITEKGATILTANRKNGLYYLNFNKEEKANAITESKTMLWHKKLGHVSEKDLKKIVKDELLRGIEIEDGHNIECETCIKGKMTRLPFQTYEGIRTQEPLEIVHSDVCGPFEIKSPAGSQYYVTFIDDYTRYCCVYFLKQKSEVLEKFIEYKNKVEKFTEKKIKFLQTDNGKEYVNKDFDDFLKREGIQRRLSTPYTPQQNGISERKNRSLMDKARCLLIDSSAPKDLWAEAVYTANYLINRTPAKALNGETPYVKWTGRTPSANHLQIFGCKAFILKKNRKGKLTPKAQEGVFVGYAQNAKGYRIYLIEKGVVIVSRDVKFVNGMAYANVANKNYDNLVKDSETLVQDPGKPEKETIISKKYKRKSKKKNNNIVKEREINENTIVFEELKNSSLDVSTPSTSRDADNVETETRPQRKRRPPLWMSDYVSSDEIPEENFLAMNCDETDEVWHNAIKDEIRAHIKNGTWVVTELKDGAKVIDYKLILKIKHSHPTIKRKARLVARGFTQRPGIDYEQTYAPTTRFSSIRTVIALSVQENLNLWQMDVTTAYLNGELNETIYMKKPGYLEKYIMDIMADEEDEAVLEKARNMLECCTRLKGTKVCELKKSLYGLKQSGRQWFIKLASELQNMGFVPSDADQCVYILRKDHDKVILTAYVDDLLLAYSSEQILKDVKNMLEKKFEMKDLGKPTELLGIEVEEFSEGVKISQTKYISKLLKQYNMEECKPTSTPIEPGLKLEKLEITETDFPYKNLLGSLMFLAVGTRPDIMYSVSYLSQFTHPGLAHIKAAKRVLRYIKGTIELGITYRKSEEKMYGMVDSDWASCIVDRKSYTGYCFMLANGCISWESKKQRSTAMSTAEAEFMALTEAAKEAIHLKKLSNDIADRKQKDIIIYSDSQAAIAIYTNEMSSRRTKHIDLRIHFLKECIQEHLINVKYQRTEDMLADLLTKGLSGPRLIKLRQSLGIEPEAA